MPSMCVGMAVPHEPRIVYSQTQTRPITRNEAEQACPAATFTAGSAGPPGRRGLRKIEAPRLASGSAARGICRCTVSGRDQANGQVPVGGPAGPAPHAHRSKPLETQEIMGCGAWWRPGGLIVPTRWAGELQGLSTRISRHGVSTLFRHVQSCPIIIITTTTAPPPAVLPSIIRKITIQLEPPPLYRLCRILNLFFTTPSPLPSSV